MSLTNPFPLNIIPKVNSPVLLAWIQQFGHETFADADDLNKIITALDFLNESQASSLPLFLGDYISIEALQDANPNPIAGNSANIIVELANNDLAVWDNDDQIWIVYPGAGYSFSTPSFQEVTNVNENTTKTIGVGGINLAEKVNLIPHTGTIKHDVNFPDKAGQVAFISDLEAIQEVISWKQPVVLAINVALGSGSNIIVPMIPETAIQGRILLHDERVILMAETNPIYNGIYRVNSQISPGNYRFYRASDASTGIELNNAIVTVQEGTYAGKTLRQSTINSIIGTSNIVFTDFGTTIAAATNVLAGIMKLYETTGTALDGSITQKALTDILLTKVDLSQLDLLLASLTLEEITSAGNSTTNGISSANATGNGKFNISNGIFSEFEMYSEHEFLGSVKLKLNPGIGFDFSKIREDYSSTINVTEWAMEFESKNITDTNRLVITPDFIQSDKQIITNESFQFGQLGILSTIATALRNWILPNESGTIALIQNIPTKTSDLENDGEGNSGFITLSDLPTDSLINKMKRGIQFFTDFEGAGPITPNLTQFISGTGAGTSRTSMIIPNQQLNQVGFCQYQTGTTGTGYANHISEGYVGVQFNIGGGSWIFESSIEIQTLFTLTDRFRFISGFGNNPTSGYDNNGIFFTYDEGASANGTVASPYWQCVTSSAAVRTLTTTNVLVNLLFNTLRIEVNADGTSVVFKINGTIVATHTTNIPVGLSKVNIKQSIVKINGVNNRNIFCDYLGYENNLTTPR